MVLLYLLPYFSMSSQPRNLRKNLKIVYVSIDDPRPASYNPRTHTEIDEGHLSTSIDIYGPIVPLVLNSAPMRRNIIIGGHFRLEVMRKLGYTEVPVVYVDIPDIKREKELNLRLNKNVGRWDLEKLGTLFDTEFLLGVGFDETDLSQIWDDALVTEDDVFDVESAIKEIKKPKAKLGDLYDLGGHRLLCGDSTDKKSIERLVGKHRIDMLYCDPPYNISLDYSAGISNKMQYGGKTKDNRTDDDYREFLQSTLANGLSVCKENCHVFTYCDQRYIGMLQQIYPELGVDFKRVVLWIKNNFNMTPQVAFNKCYEPCVYGTRGSPYLSPRAQNFTEILNKEISNGNRTIDDVLDMIDIFLCKRLPTTDYEHPTAKNPLLHERPLRRCTKPGNAVLDLFGGSGSTLIAAHQMKRKCFLMEWDPVFVDVILRRFEAAFSIKPTLIKS